MVIALGSMAIKGVFKAGEMVSGLAKTMTGLKQTQKEGKSTNTEMKRMTGTTKKLAGALAMIGAGGFTALMMTAPQLSASLFRIKMQLQMIAWTVGRHLKPLLDAVGKILKGIRTGDWSMFFEGLSDAWSAAKGVISKAWQWIKNVYNGLWEWLETQGIEKPGWVIWIEGWILELERIIIEKDWDALWDWVIAPFKVVWDRFLETKMGSMVKKIMDEVKKEDATFISIGTYIWEGIWKGIMDGIKSIPGSIIDIFARDEENRGWKNSPVFDDIRRESSRKALHEEVFADYYAHTGTSYQPLDSGGTTRVEKQEIILDFTGAHFDLAGGTAEIQSFAERVSEYIAAKQQELSI